MLRVGIVGVGTIGRAIARAIGEGKVKAVLAGLTGRDQAKARAFASALRPSPTVLPLPLLIQASDLVIEAATQDALIQMAPQILGAGKDLMILSVGALLGHEEWVKLARERGGKIHVPSGAIAGLDGVKGASMGQIRKVTMETRKPPAGLKGAPYLNQHRIDLGRVTEPTLIFEGSARQAVVGFPANVNVVAALSLAGIGPDLTRIRIFADPSVTMNIHRIRVEGEFGTLEITIENVPSETNPRTGRLSALSAIAYLERLTSTLQIGT